MSPVRASAQDVETVAQDPLAPTEAPSRGLQRWHPEAYEGTPASPSSRSTSLELELDHEGLAVSPPPPPLSGPEAKIRRAKAGIAVSTVFIAIGAAAIGAGVAGASSADDIGSAIGAVSVGAALGTVAIIGGLVGAGISARNLNEGRRELGEIEDARYRGKRRVRWDTRRGRFVF